MNLIKEAEDLRVLAGKPGDPRCWFVGRTDLGSYTGGGIPEHWAYGPDTQCVQFLGYDREEALMKAVKFCKKRNKELAEFGLIVGGV